jgi:hypothetical protein
VFRVWEAGFIPKDYSAYESTGSGLVVAPKNYIL